MFHAIIIAFFTLNTLFIGIENRTNWFVLEIIVIFGALGGVSLVDLDLFT